MKARTTEGLLFLPPQVNGGQDAVDCRRARRPDRGVVQQLRTHGAVLSGQGWAVFRPNPRGSTGYGAAFAAANKNDLGGGDYRDIMTGTRRRRVAVSHR